MSWVPFLGGVASAVYSGIQANNAANTQGQLTAQQIQQQFQDQMYLNQYARKTTLEDRNAKIKAIDRWNGWTPANAATFVPGSVPGSPQLFDTSNLAQFDPSIVGDGSSSNPNSLVGYLAAHPNGS